MKYFAVHPTAGDAPEMYALLPNDGGRGILIGERHEVEDLLQCTKKAPAKTEYWEIVRYVTDTEGYDDIYTLFPLDGSDELQIGNRSELNALLPVIETFLDAGRHGDEISEHAERLGWTWMTVAEAANEYNIPAITIRTACLRGDIPEARQGHNRRWEFPALLFRGWVIDKNKHRPGPKPATWRVDPTGELFTSRQAAIAWLETEQNAKHTGDGEWTTFDGDGDIETEWTICSVEYKA